jgi:phenylalanyl-tRNA synthetase beta chain
MKISYNWLQSYIVETLPEPDKLADKIIFGAFEVEESEKIGNDTVFEIKVLPDRAHDCQSHYGMAREVAGLLGLTFKDTNEYFKPIDGSPTDLKIDIQTKLCRRYMGRIIRGVKIGPSPDWLKNYLEAIGQRSINNIVDATNLVMFDVGQPTHAFDAKKIYGNNIVIAAVDQEINVPILSGESKQLQAGEMVIMDDKNILAIAGVKGGTKAEVDENTTDILIEVANFDPVSVRKTARRLNILTDSAKRFENELTPERADLAMRELSAAIKEMCPDAIFEDVVDVYPSPVQQNHVQFGTDYINARLGTALSVETISDILTRYGYEFAEDASTFTVAIPFERIDITGPHDMLEEIGRAYGYNNVPATLPILTNTPMINSDFAKVSAIKSDLTEKGYHEAMTYSFTKKGDYEVARGAVGKSALRKNLTEGIKESYEMNRLNKELLEIDDMKIFEIGTIFVSSGEQIHVAYADKKGITEITLDEYIAKNNLEISSSSYDIPEVTSNLQNFVMWSEYPYIARDIAVWASEEVSADTIANVIRENAGELLMKGPRLFDTFTKDGKTSYAFRMVFQSNMRTLIEQEITDIMNKITTNLQNKGWEVR